MKVLHVINTGHRNFGGKERATLELICGLREQGVDAELLSLRPGLTDAFAKDRGIPTFVPKVGWPQNARLVVETKRIIKEHRFELVHTHDFRENVIGRLAARLAGVPVVTTVHGLAKFCLDMPRHKRLAYHALDMLTAPMSSAFIVLSETDTNLLGHRVPKEKVQVIRPALRTSKMAGANKRERGNPPVFGSAGRLDSQKGFDIFIKAAAKLLAEGIDARFVLAGTGAGEAELRNLVHELGIDSRFKLLGFVKDMDGFYESIDVFVLPSRVERSPMTILEARAHGLPVIATDVGGVREMLSGDAGGILVPPDDTEALADAMRQVLSDPELAKAARTDPDAQNASFDEMINLTIKLYREVLNQR